MKSRAYAPHHLGGVGLACALVIAGCGDTRDVSAGHGGAGSTSGGSSGGSTATRGGTTAAGGLPGFGGGASGGTTSFGGASNAGATSAGGALSAGGAVTSGGATTSDGGANLGGRTSAGGALNRGGAPASGGATASLGGGVSGGGVSGGGVSGGGVSGGGTTGGAPSSCPPAQRLTGGKQYCSNSKGSAGSGYSYERWASGSGSGCMTVYGKGAAFSATWTNVGDFLARIGLQFDQTKTPTQLGTLSSDFAETKTGGDGLVYVGIYGWSVNPLREYYIIDDWGSSRPADLSSDGTPRTKMGEITVDGDTYDVWTHTQTNKPAITGNNQTFVQYFSVRRTARQCGHISISEHFSKWGQLGMQLGKMEEATLLVEAQDSTGTIDFSSATIVVK